ncbi:MATE family efflux transporter [Chengkuizengella sediminis]|uniref:MATE family efflux transporter n=1 Tax=Chengkuizengella sediminis TaxID=1885917 RepID=UPI00138A2688|nr:MATE family efflux transporter [Chengkuizengella sediminis]NDI35519.1 MATE family efflux transporter [Chengkuizengella sediminis]
MEHPLGSSQTNKQVIKFILVLALPAVIENFFQTILGFIDTLFVSQLGLIQVSAVGVTNAILAIYFAVFMSLGVATNVFVAKNIGAGDKDKASQIGQQAIILSAIVGVLFGIISIFFAEPLLKLMGVEKDVLSHAYTYFRIVAIPSILISLMFVLSSILRGTGDSKTPMKVSIVANLLNIILDYILIFGFFFIPSFGLAGAAWATVLSRFIGVIGLSIYIFKSKSIQIKKDNWKIDKKSQLKLMRLGTPAAGERLVMRVGQVLYFGMIIAIGTNTFAAHQIAGNIEIFSYMIGYGFATAATTLVGQKLGENDYDGAKKYASMSMILGTVCMTIFGILLFFLGNWAASFFTSDLDVIKQIALALKIDAFIQPVLAIVLILTGIYQGGENTKFPMYITAIGMWLIRTIGVYFLGIYLGWGIAGIWIAIGLDNLFRAICLWVRYKNNGWIKNI